MVYLMLTIINIMTISENLSVLSFWALPQRLHKARKRPENQVNQTNVNFTGTGIDFKLNFHN